MTASVRDGTYLGDGVYATFDGYHIWLTTEGGCATTSRIALHPGVFAALLEYERKVYRRAGQAKKGGE